MGSLMEIRRRMMQEDVLPPKYQRVEYITGSLRSYFDTGVAGNDNTLKIDLIYKAENMSAYAPIVGNYDGNRNKNCWCLRQNDNVKQISFLSNSSSFATNIGIMQFDVDTLLGKKVQAHFEYGELVCIVNGIEYSHTIREYSATTSEANIFVGNYPATVSYGTSHSFYSLRITKQGKLIRNYIPCYRKSDNKAGMYDLVNHTFNPSTGAADFIIPS